MLFWLEKKKRSPHGRTLGISAFHFPTAEQMAEGACTAVRNFGFWVYVARGPKHSSGDSEGTWFCSTGLFFFSRL